jgi:hypothetical protein
MLQITHHSVMRYQQRVANVTVTEAMGAKIVRLGARHRAIIEDGHVVTILPPEQRNGRLYRVMQPRSLPR